MSFVERHGLWSGEQQEAAVRLRKIVEEKNLEVIRLSFPDQHGILRGKTLIASEAIASLESGCSITTTMLAKDTSHKTVFPVFTAGGGFGMKEMEGAADVLMVADPSTFRVLPWAPTTGWLLCDLHFSDGRPVPFATRHLYRKVIDQLGERGYDFVAGLEVEFHLFKLDDTPAILVGMDMLRLFNRVAIDFGRSEVRFNIGENWNPPTRQALNRPRNEGVNDGSAGLLARADQVGAGLDTGRDILRD